MIIRGLGVVGAVHRGDLTRLQPAQRKILAVLIAAGPDGLSSDHFADQVWPEDALPSDWEGAVRQSISRMRRAIGLHTIVSSTRHYSLSPAVEVDVWKLLAAGGSSLDALSDEDLVALLSGEPYAGVELAPMLQSSIQQIAAERVQLIDRIVDQVHRASPPVLQATRDFLAQQPYREDVLVGVTQLHAAAGLDAQALHLLNHGIEHLEAELDISVGAELRALRATLATGQSVHDLSEESVGSSARWIGSLDITTRDFGIERLGLVHEAESHLGVGGLILTGDSGTGKTVLARRLAADSLTEGSHVVWITAQRDQSAAYGPFIAALPWLVDHLGPLLTDGGDAYSRSVCWSASVDSIRRALPNRRISVFVDDAQWLDSQSQMFLEFLTQARVAQDLSVTVVGRSATPDTGWMSLLDALGRSGLAIVETADFTREELIDLVGRSHPSSTSKQRLDLADELIAAKATLPATVTELLSSVDPSELISVRDARYRSTMPLLDQDVWTSGVSETAGEFAAVAAVVGIIFRIDDVATLTNASGREVLEAVDELLDAQLVTAGQRPDEFSFRHILIHGAFESLLDRPRWRDLHLQAAEPELGQDLHRRAAHLFNAGALVDSPDLGRALVESALAYQAVGSFREAARNFARAIEVNPAAVDGQLLLDYANALDLSGANGWAARRRAFESAQDANDHELSVEVATARAHETQDIFGDDRRVELLDQVDLEQLGADALRKHHVSLARELSFLGEHDRARELSQSVIDAALDPDDRCDGWLSAWLSYMARPAGDWPAPPDDRELILDPVLRAQMLQVECTHSLLLGDDAASRDLLARCGNPGLVQTPVRAWFVSLLQAMVAFTDGDWTRSNAVADAGCDEAHRAGISSAFSARAAQTFVQHWIQNSHDALLPFLEGAAPDVQGSMLAESAYAVAVATDPERQGEARDKVEQLADKVAASRSPFTPSVAALLASASVHQQAPQLARQLTELIEPFTGTALVVGTGVASLGPATRALSMLATSPADAADLMGTAIDEADRWNLRAWSVRCRLDLSELTGDNRLRSEARDLAVGTDLATAMFDA